MHITRGSEPNVTGNACNHPTRGTGGGDQVVSKGRVILLQPLQTDSSAFCASIHKDRGKSRLISQGAFSGLLFPVMTAALTASV